jgi:YidC/Oxa1 family membrane protein insertase
MGASTFWTQRQLMARAGTTDPQQVMVQKLLLYVLPLSFAVSGVFFPIGVLLYWLTTNVWSMGQQAWVIKRMPPVNLNPGKPAPEVKAAKKPTTEKTVSPSAPSAGTGVTTAVPGRTGGATPRAAVSAAGNRRPSGARKNKSRRGGRR